LGRAEATQGSAAQFQRRQSKDKKALTFLWFDQRFNASGLIAIILLAHEIHEKSETLQTSEGFCSV
jgi:hypothetical protein